MKYAPYLRGGFAELVGWLAFSLWEICTGGWLMLHSGEVAQLVG